MRIMPEGYSVMDRKKKTEAVAIALLRSKAPLWNNTFTTGTARAIDIADIGRSTSEHSLKAYP